MKHIEEELGGIRKRAELKQFIEELPDDAEVVLVARYSGKDKATCWSFRGITHCTDAALTMLTVAVQSVLRQDFGT